MKIVYVVDFSVEGSSGKHKATREKAAALKNLLGDANVYFYYPTSSKKKLTRMLGLFSLDYKMFITLLSKPADYFFISRVLLLPLTRLLLFVKGVKVFSEFHADFKEEIPLLNKSKSQQAILHILAFFFNLNFKISHGIIFNHPYLKNKFDPILKKPSIYSYNGANYKELSPGDLKENRQLLSLPQDAIIFLFLGSVSQWHGVDYLIDIFNSEQLMNRKDVYLYIVGGKKNAYVNSLIERSTNPNVLFKDPVPTNIAQQYINSSDYCMLPVKHNRTSPGSPLKLYDYISCGKPVITQKDTAGYSDEVLKYNLGFITDFTDVNVAIGDILDIIALNNSSSFLENNVDVARNKVSWLERMKDWMKFIEEVAESPKPQ